MHLTKHVRALSLAQRIPIKRKEYSMNKLLLVSDYSIPGVRSAKKIYELAKELGIKMSGAFLVINKISGPLAPLAGEINDTGLDVAGSVPYDEELVSWNISNKPIFDFHDEVVENEVGEIFNKITA